MELTDSKTGKTGKTRRRPEMESTIFGKVPPQAKDLEEAILGAIMIEKSAIDAVAEFLQPDCFYVESHQRIYRAMLELVQVSQPIDILTVAEKLRANRVLEECGGFYYIAKLTNS